MEISSDLIALLIIIVFIFLLIVGIIYSIVTKRTGVSSINSVTFFGAAAEFYNEEKKRC